jgi:hypothetical protein
MFFSLGLMPALEAARDDLRAALQCPEVDYYFLIDDIVWVAPLPEGDAGLAAMKLVQSTTARYLAGLGLKIKQSKTTVLYPAGRAPLVCPLTARTPPEFIEVLGVAVFHSATLSVEGRLAVKEFVKDRILNGSRGQQHLQRLRTLRDPVWRRFPAQAFTIIRRNILPSTVYITRNSPTWATVEALKEIDAEVRKTAGFLLQIPQVSNMAYTAMTLPVGLGGLGIYNTAEIAEITHAGKDFVSSRVERKNRDIWNRKKRDKMMEDLRVIAVEGDEMEKAQAQMMMEAQAPYDPGNRSTRNTTARLLKDAPAVSAPAYLLELYRGLGYIPETLRRDSFRCKACRKDVPLGERMTHINTCTRLSKTPRHDQLRNKCLAMAREAIGYSNVMGEHMVPLRPGTNLEDTTHYRSDLEFVFRNELYRVDFGITKNSMIVYKNEKTHHYQSIALVAETPFTFIPVIMSTGLQMDPVAEFFIRHLARHFQEATTGQHSNAGTSRIMAELLAGIAERQLTLYRLMIGESSMDPQALFTTSPLLNHSDTSVAPPSAQQQPTRVRAAPCEEAFVEQFMKLDMDQDEGDDGVVVSE